MALLQLWTPSLLCCNYSPFGDLPQPAPSYLKRGRTRAHSSQDVRPKAGRADCFWLAFLKMDECQHSVPNPCLSSLPHQSLFLSGDRICGCAHKPCCSKYATITPLLLDICVDFLVVFKLPSFCTLVMALKFTKTSLLSEMSRVWERGLLTFYSRGRLRFRNLCKN